ncbi:MAG: hypothetical protein ACYC3W_10570 [Candidatus Nanopelagicales bacterium]
MRFLILILMMASIGHAEMPTAHLERVYKTDWLRDSALKAGLVSSFCVAQSLSGLKEAHRWDTDGTTYLINESNYHVFRTLADVSWVGAGWFLYGNLSSDRISWGRKLCRVTGAALISRNAFEWSYKYGRYGNPFDYSEEHNRHALVYFKFDRRRLVDAYVSLGPVSGPVVDVACIALGVLLIR